MVYQGIRVLFDIDSVDRNLEDHLYVHNDILWIEYHFSFQEISNDRTEININI